MARDNGSARAPHDDNTGANNPVYATHQTLVFGSTEQVVEPEGQVVPLSIFASRLSGLQALVRYLHDAGKLSFSEIASLLNRSPKTIWATYAVATRLPFTYEECTLNIPVARFATRELSVLETLVTYIGALGFSNVDIARLLALDPRTTWTVKKRAEKKGVSLR